MSSNANSLNPRPTLTAQFSASSDRNGRIDSASGRARSSPHGIAEFSGTADCAADFRPIILFGNMTNVSLSKAQNYERLSKRAGISASICLVVWLLFMFLLSVWECGRPLPLWLATGEAVLKRHTGRSLDARSCPGSSTDSRPTYPRATSSRTVPPGLHSRPRRAGDRLPDAA